MDSSTRTSKFFVAGGALPHDAPCYVSRPADDELFNSVLAGHFGYVFAEELSPGEQLALFNPADPRAVGEQLVTVVKAVYSDPNLENNQQNNDLLVAMAEPLPQLEN